MRVYGATNAGALEIATGDDASEPIYVRQYKNSKTGSDTYSQYYSGTPTRTLTLLDASGNTSIPGNLTVNGTITNSIITDMLNRLIALENENKALKSDIIKLQDLHLDWRSFYQGFDLEVPAEKLDQLSYKYNAEDEELNIMCYNPMAASEYLAIFKDLDGKSHFIHIDYTNGYYNLDEIYRLDMEGSMIPVKLNLPTHNDYIPFNIAYYKY